MEKDALRAFKRDKVISPKKRKLEHEIGIKHKSTRIPLSGHDRKDSTNNLDFEHPIDDGFAATFVDIISHEYRAPFLAILNCIERLENAGFNAQQGEFIAKIKRIVATSSDIPSRVYEWMAKKTRHEQFSIVKIVKACEEVLELTIGEKYERRIDPRVAQSLVYGDEGAVHHILRNLLENAVKFADGGRIALQVQLVDELPASTIKFVVEDTGIGITNEAIRKAFNRYERIDPSVIANYDGKGLGLYLAKSLVDNLKGEIGLSPGPQKIGTTAWFQLRFNLDLLERRNTMIGMPHSEALPERSNELTFLRHRKVLFTDDNSTCRELSERLLRKYMCQVQMAESGEECLRLVEEDGIPDIFFLDCQMPGLNGSETAAAIRKKYPDIPIIGLTAGIATVQEDMDAVWTKPMTIDNLVQLNEMLGRG